MVLGSSVVVVAVTQTLITAGLMGSKRANVSVRLSACSYIFVQTKLWRSFVGKDPKNGKPRCDSELRKSLRKLGLKYVDLWLMHWPGPGRHLNYPPVKEGMKRPKVST